MRVLQGTHGTGKKGKTGKMAKKDIAIFAAKISIFFSEAG